MKRTYRLTRIADEDLTNIWISSRKNWGMAQADKYLSELEACFISLVSHPKLGRQRPEIRLGYRSIPTNHHIIFYREQPQSCIEIIRILHERMEVRSHMDVH